MRRVFSVSAAIAEGRLPTVEPSPSHIPAKAMVIDFRKARRPNARPMPVFVPLFKTREPVMKPPRSTLKA